MPHADAGPQSYARMSYGRFVMSSAKLHCAENDIAVRQKLGLVHGHHSRLKHPTHPGFDLN